MTIALRSDAGGTSGGLQLNGVDQIVLNADGLPTIPNSPAQFDATKKLATMEAVQQALGNMSGVRVITASATLTADDAGGVVLANIASAGVLTLPAFANVAVGAKFYVQCGTATGAITVNAPAGMSFNAPNAGGASMTIQPGVAVEFIYLSSSTILATNGAGMASLTANGYQKLPGGLILQWGTAGYTGGSGSVTFPLAFPNACYAVTIGSTDTVVGPKPTFSVPTTTGFNIYDADTTANTLYYMAIGR